DTRGGKLAERALLVVGEADAPGFVHPREKVRGDVLVRAARNVPHERRVVERAAVVREDRVERRVVKVLGLRERAVEVEQHAGTERGAAHETTRRPSPVTSSSPSSRTRAC